MQWSDAVSEGLPPARDDEPAELRRDIVDELADHLACATSRELRNCEDEAAARQAALDGFGDPRRLARRLWFDWMKERIMTQRITYGVLATLAAACVAAFVLAWLSFQQTRDLTQQTIELNQAMLAKLETLVAQSPAQAAAPAASMEWTEAVIRCVKGEKGGPPADGFNVQLHGKALGPDDIIMSEETGADGSVRFGPIRPGQYSLSVAAPEAWGLHNEFQLRQIRSIVVFPGRPHSEEIICPAQAPAMAEISVQVDWPDDLRDKAVVLSCSFQGSGETRKFGGYQWAAHPFELYPSTIQILADTGAVVSRRGDRVDDRRVRWFADQYELKGVGVILPRWVDASTTNEGVRKLLDELQKRNFPPRASATYEARPDAENKWQIAVPEELLQAIRETLSKLEAAKSS